MIQDAHMGEIRMFAGPGAPDGWLPCDGQLMDIRQFTALFSLLGTTFGGDGNTTFALPDLRGCIPVHVTDSLPVGALAPARSEDEGTEGEAQPYAGLLYIIATDGIFPSAD